VFVFLFGKQRVHSAQNSLTNIHPFAPFVPAHAAHLQNSFPHVCLVVATHCSLDKVVLDFNDDAQVVTDALFGLGIVLVVLTSARLHFHDKWASDGLQRLVNQLASFPTGWILPARRTSRHERIAARFRSSLPLLYRLLLRSKTFLVSPLWILFCYQ